MVFVLLLLLLLLLNLNSLKVFCDVGLWVGHGKGRKIQFVQYKNQYAYRESL